VYNEITDIAKTANEIFSPVIFAVLVECLTHVFYQSLNLFFAESRSRWYLAYIVSYAIFNYARFVVICASVSSVTNMALDAKYEIQELSDSAFNGKLEQNVAKLNQHYPAFALLDSNIIDKSFVLSASGILLTYGVMIATFSESSKNS
jgi:hypothetical protein